jgi:hypothetical protein
MAQEQKKELDPSTPSMAYSLSLPSWTIANDLMGGAAAVRLKGEVYLPKFPQESTGDYNARLKFAPLTNHYLDHLSTITSKPFTKQVSVDDSSISKSVKELLDDVDGEGNSLHTFTAEVYHQNVAKGAHYVLVDYPDGMIGANLKQERDAGVRPFWVQIEADQMLAISTARRGDRDVVTYARWKEEITEPSHDGFGERVTVRVRVLKEVAERDQVDNELDGEGKIIGATVARLPAGIEFEVWEKTREQDQAETKWAMVDSGPFTLDEIPIGIFQTSKKYKTGQIRPPLEDLAEVQLAHYRQENGLWNILEYAGFPMLKGVGVELEPDPENPGKFKPIVVGPRVVLTTPPNMQGGSQSDWDFIEPSGASIEKILANLERMEASMSKLGMAPLVKSGVVTATAENINDSRAHSRAQKWAQDTGTGVEKLIWFTGLWLNQGEQNEKAKVEINTEFGIDLGSTEDAKMLQSMNAAGQLSKRTLWEELKRRNILNPRFDPEKEEQLLEEEGSAAHEQDDGTGEIPPGDPNDDTEDEETPPEQREAA